MKLKKESEQEKLTLKEWCLKELETWYQSVNKLPKNQLEKELKNDGTWDRIVWYLEWLSENLQKEWVKKIQSLFQKNNILYEKVLRKAALKYPRSNLFIFDD